MGNAIKAFAPLRATWWRPMDHCPIFSRVRDTSRRHCKRISTIYKKNFTFVDIVRKNTDKVNTDL